MKQLLLFISIIFSVSFLTVKCKDNAGVLPPPSIKHVYAIYTDSNGNRTGPLIFRQIIADTSKYDSAKQRSYSVRITVSQYEVYDSAREKDGKPKLDSLGRPSMILIGYRNIPAKDLIFDLTNKDVDSLMKRDTTRGRK